MDLSKIIINKQSPVTVTLPTEVMLIDGVYEIVGGESVTVFQGQSVTIQSDVTGWFCDVISR